MFDIKENLKKLPDKPGVYLHKDKMGQVIYVGKASSLKNRVRQYFQSSKSMDPKVRALVSHIAEFEYITTASEMEALILECNLIKEHMPKYNVLLRDDKTYPYIKITLGEEYPRLVKTRRLEKDGARYFGPYADVTSVNQILDLLNHLYRLKRCSARSFPENFRPCLNFHIGECSGACIRSISPEDYREGIQQVIQFLNGRTAPLLSSLKRQMEEASESLQFEAAAEFRDCILSVKSIEQKQNVVILGAGDIDILTILEGARNHYGVLFYLRGGKLSGRDLYKLQVSPEDSREDMTRAFIEQYYSDTRKVPGEILIQYDIPEKELLEEFLSDLAGRRVKITHPLRGEKKATLELVKKDLIEMAGSVDAKALHDEEREKLLGEEMEGILNEHDVLNGRGSGSSCGSPCSGPGAQVRRCRVEAYDISNINGVDSVGAMVVFEGLKKIQKDYRRFKIRTVEGPNDYGSLQEVVYRRFKRLQEGDPGFAKMPDVLFIDGGIGQVRVVEKVLDAMKINLPVFGMAKDDSHRTKELVFLARSGEEERTMTIPLKERPLLFRYAGTIQEEVHRFAIEYHRGLRGKKLQKSVLDEIPGIGPTKRNRLLTAFGSIDAIRKASPEELNRVDGIRPADAENIVNFFR
jgi:excinuclease ABC subunit C